MKIQTFIDRISINKQYAKSTISSYTRVLKSFDSYLKSLSLWKRWIEDTDKVTVDDIESYIWTEKVKWKSARTCNGYLACLRDFIWYAEHKGEKVFNYKQIPLMKEKRRKIEALSESEVQILLNYMRNDNSKDELTKTRDYAIVSILLNTWLRVSELCNIKVSDVQEELQIIWKNNTLRLVYLFQEHITLIRLYLFLRRWKKIESEYLFCSHSNNAKWAQLTRTTVESIVKTAGINAWISDPVWPHKLRHTFATSLLRRWGNIYYIKELLWHEHISTTQTYLSATNLDLKKTQTLLKDVRGVEQLEEQLDPMPEQFVIKDPNLFEMFRKKVTSVQWWFGRGVSYLWYWL